jgi:hypothetical protein
MPIVTRFGPTGGNVQLTAISSNVFFDKSLATHYTGDERSTEFPKNPGTINFPPQLHCYSLTKPSFVRQVFITTRTLPFFSAENIALLLPLEARATQECKLKAVRGSVWFGVAPLLVRPRQVPPP